MTAPGGRTFRMTIPACPDDMERGVDPDGVLWTRQKGAWRFYWANGQGEPVTWVELMRDRGGLTEVLGDGRA